MRKLCWHANDEDGGGDNCDGMVEKYRNGEDSCDDVIPSEQIIARSISH